jgi:hypothetical protein
MKTPSSSPSRRDYEDMEYSLTWDEYSKMSDTEKVGVFEYFYRFFNQNALQLDLPQRMVCDHVKSYMLKQERYEFLAMIRDFEAYYGDLF